MAPVAGAGAGDPIASNRRRNLISCGGGRANNTGTSTKNTKHTEQHNDL
jgi:hypothetical protein